MQAARTTLRNLLFVFLSAIALTLALPAERVSADAVTCGTAISPVGDVAALIAAIDCANGNIDADSFDLGGGTYNITDADAVYSSLGLTGLPPITTTITLSNGTIARDAAALNDFRLISIETTGAVFILDVVLQNGSLPTGEGGLIRNSGGLTLQQSILWDGQANVGGAIRNSGNLEIYSSQISGNLADFGGGIYNTFNTTLEQVTIAGNRATSQGGGFWNGAGTVTMRNSVIHSNAAPTGSNIRVAGGSFTAQSSLYEGTSGTVANLSGNIIGSDPLFIAPLAPTSAPVTGGNYALSDYSLAVDAADDSLNVIGVDLAGNAIYNDAGVVDANPSQRDMGAFEKQTDSPLIIVSPTSGLLTTEDGGMASFEIVLAAPPSVGNTVTIGLSSSIATEGTPGVASVVFDDTNWNVPQTVTITGADDAAVDGAQNYMIVTAAAISGDPIFNGLDASDVDVINSDNDTAGVTITPTSGLVTTEAGGTATFDVVLNTIPTAPVTINFTSSDTTEGTPSPASATFAADATALTPQTITVTGVDDLIIDGSVNYTIQTPVISGSADATYNGVNPPNVQVTNTDDDVPNVTVTPTSGLVTTEAGGTATFTVVLDAAPTDDVTIAISSSDTGEATVLPVSLTFTAVNFNTPQTVTVTGVDDFVVDGSAPFTIITGNAVSLDTNYDGAVVADVTGNNTDDDVAGVTVNPISGLVTTEAGGTATFTVVLDAQPSLDVIINLSSSDTTEGTISPASLTFTNLNWNVAQTVTITGVDDFIDDGDIAYSIITADTSSADAAFNGLVVDDVTVSNTDDDTLTVTVTPTTFTVNESGGVQLVSISLGSQPLGDVIINLSGGDATEATFSPATLTFTAVNFATAQTVTVTGVDDGLDDGDIMSTIVVDASSVADTAYDAFDPADITVTTIDDDTLDVIVTPAVISVGETVTTGSFTVNLGSQPLGDVTITLTIGDTSEVDALPLTLTFTAVNFATPQTVNVNGVDDAVDDGDVNSFIVIDASSAADTAYDAFDPTDVAVTTIDDDTFGVSVTPTSGLVTTEFGGTATFTVVLNSAPTSNVTIPVSSSNVAEGTVSPTSLVFTVINWNTPQTVTVTGVDDGITPDGDVAYTVLNDAATSTDVLYNGFDPADVSVTNNDNDTAGVTITPLSGLVTTEAGGTALFSVVLDILPSADVTFSLTSSDTSEGTVSVGSLTFTSVNWDTPQMVMITGQDDDLDDGDIAYTIVTGDAVSTDVLYTGLVIDDVSASNTDDDTSNVSVGAPDLVSDESGATAEVTYVLLAEPTADVTFNVSSSDTTEGTISVTSLTFTAANWDTPQSVIVTGVDDSLVDGNIGYLIVADPITSADVNYNAIDPGDQGLTNNDDDLAGVTINPISGLTTSETGTTATFTAVLTAQPSADVTFSLTSDNTAEGTVSPATLTFTDADWDIPQTVTITGVDDVLADGNIAYNILTGTTASADTAFSGINPDDVAVSNIDDEVPGLIITPTSGLVTTEAGDTAIFTVQLTIAPLADVTIILISDDISEGTVSSVTLTFTVSDFATPQTVTVIGVDDFIDDGDIAYNISVDPTSLDAGYNALATETVAVSNTDDDTAGITATPSGTPLVTSEMGGTATISVALNSEPTADVTIAVSSDTLAEGTVSPASLTFTDLNWDVPQVVTVTGVDDAVFDGNINYNVTLDPSGSADALYAALMAQVFAAVNNDDELPPVGFTVDTAGLVDTTEAGGTTTFTVVLNYPPTADVVVLVSSSDITEGTVSPISLTFTTGNWNVAQTVTVTGVDDVLDDGDIAYTVILDTAVSADPLYDGLDPVDVSLNNVDDDATGLVLTPAGGLVTTEAGGTATFTIALATEPTSSVVINLSSDDATEGTVSPISVTFTTANWNVAQTVTVTGVDDAIADGNVAYNVVTATAISADATYNGFDGPDVAVTNSDNDTAGVTVNPLTLTVDEAGATADFTVVLNTAPLADVTIDFSSADTGEATITPDPLTLTFTTVNWNVPQTVTVTGVDDLIDDGDVVVNITSAPAVSTDPAYNGLDAADVAVTVADDDGAGITVTPTSITTSETGTTATFTIVLQSLPTGDVTIGLTSGDATEGTVAPASLTFTPADWDVPQTVTVTGLDDSLGDGSVVYNVFTAPAVSTDAVYDTLDAVDVSVTNTDDEVANVVVSPTTLTMPNLESRIYTIALTREPAGNVVVNIGVSPGCTVTPTSVTITPANWTTAQSVTITGFNVGTCNTIHSVTGAAPYAGQSPANVTATVTALPVSGAPAPVVPAPSVPVPTGVSAASADQRITITLSSGFAQPGDQLTITIAVRNITISQADGLNGLTLLGQGGLTEIMAALAQQTFSAVYNVPAEFEILSSSSTIGTVAVVGQQVTFSGSLGANGTAVATIQVRIKPATATPFNLANQACVGASCATVNLLSVGQLPITGETPAWVSALRDLLAAGRITPAQLRMFGLSVEDLAELR